MPDNQIFVGRQDELRQFRDFLEDPKGGAAIVVGQAGMGKTWLINKMAKIAEEHKGLKCGFVRYEITPTDSVDSIMALMIDNAFEASQVTEGSFSGTTRRLEQWRSFLNVLNLGDLVISLSRNPQRNTRDQFLERLSLISKQMSENGRAVFIVDLEKYMQPDSDQSWAIVIKNLPDKIKFVFAQRPEDVLVNSQVINRLNNTVRIPNGDLGILTEEDVDNLLYHRKDELSQPLSQVRDALGRYNGHPYATGAALDLLVAGVNFEELPQRPEPIDFASVQWKEICKHGKEAVRSFKAYAILQVPVPDKVMQAVSQVDDDSIHVIMADNYLAALFRNEPGGKRIYHTILADYILSQMADDEQRQYHIRAIDFYREKLKQARENQAAFDPLVATRLPEHVLAAESKEGFFRSLIDECRPVMERLGLLENMESLFLRALNIAENDSRIMAVLFSNLGTVYSRKGDFRKAEEVYFKSLEIYEMIHDVRGISIVYNNLGLLYMHYGELCKAEEMNTRSLEISQKIGYEEGLRRCPNLS